MARIRKSDNEEVSYWLSYSDMMAALLLVFALIISLTAYQSRKQYEIKQAKIKEQEAIIEDLLNVKSDIIDSLVKEFENSGLELTIDEKTGDILLNSDVLFDPDSAVLKESSKKFLNKFLPRYFGVLMGEDYVNNIAEIIIEGHTAKYGTYIGCLELSQDRAFAVAEFIVDDNSILKKSFDLEKLRKKLTFNGKAYTDPILLENGKRDDKKSRRVEIKFRLKNDEIIEQINELIK